MSVEDYGAPVDRLHPQHASVVSDALDRLEADQATSADRFILWADAAIAAAWARLERHSDAAPTVYKLTMVNDATEYVVARSLSDLDATIRTWDIGEVARIDVISDCWMGESF